MTGSSSARRMGRVIWVEVDGTVTGKDKDSDVREELEGPVSVRSNIRTKSPGSSCMCIAETPMLAWRSCHSPWNDEDGVVGSCDGASSAPAALAMQLAIRRRWRSKDLGLGMAAEHASMHAIFKPFHASLQCDKLR